MFRARFVVPLIALAFCCGCPTSSNPDAAVLSGTWDVVFADVSGLGENDVTATFDSNGTLTTLNATAATGATATLSVSGSDSQVNGSDVTITIPNTLGTSTITGTLSSDQNTLDGTLSKEINLSGLGLTVTLPASDLTMTRVTQ